MLKLYAGGKYIIIRHSLFDIRYSLFVNLVGRTQLLALYSFRVTLQKQAPLAFFGVDPTYLQYNRAQD
jgi:hypothetical protein